MATQKLMVRKPETKSRRLFMVLRPSLYDSVKRIAIENGISVNDTISQMLESYIADYDRDNASARNKD